MAETDWVELLQQENVEDLWNAIFRLVSRHPSVRPLRFATDETAVASEFEINADLTQELFLELFQKQRFDYYVDHDYSSTEIENELTHIELPNLVGARLRKRYPESFRMARRVSSLLKSSPRFQVFDRRSTGNGSRKKAAGSRGSKRPVGSAARAAAVSASAAGVALLEFPKRNGAGSNGHWDDELEKTGSGNEPLDEVRDNGVLLDREFDDDEAEQGGKPERRERMVNRVYGLKKWPRNKAVSDPGRFPELVRSVAMRKRDTRIVGRSATSQLIVSNSELEKLIAEVFLAIDSPADVKTIRQLTLSRIPLQDYNIAALDSKLSAASGESGFTDTTYAQVAPDERLTPEEELIDEEHRAALLKLAGRFLEQLLKVVNNNNQRYARLLTTLWYCYYDPDEPSQLEIAKLLGVSDSLVSDNRKIVEHELRKLKLNLEDASVFAEALRPILSARLTPERQLRPSIRAERRAST